MVFTLIAFLITLLNTCQAERNGWAGHSLSISDIKRKLLKLKLIGYLTKRNAVFTQVLANRTDNWRATVVESFAGKPTFSVLSIIICQPELSAQIFFATTNYNKVNISPVSR